MHWPAIDDGSPGSHSGCVSHAIQMQIEIRRPWRTCETVFLLGPGGVGKSSVGLELSKRLGWASIDLDLEFCASIAEIGWFIPTKGYELYRAENLSLAHRLASAADAPVFFITSSGFLAGQPGSSDYFSARRLIRTGYRVTLLPAMDVDTATSIVVERQLRRGFGFQRDAETQKFRQRFDIYKSEGDMLVVSASTPSQIAAAIEQAFRRVPS